MNKSDNIGQLAAALSIAQGEMKAALENAKNPFFKSTYADFGAIVDAVREPFSKNGLSYTQLPKSRDGHVALETVLMHSSGEWISDTLELPLAEERGISNVQALGKTITYMRRYALAAIAGVYSEQDDDGETKRENSPVTIRNTASERAQPAPAPKKTEWTEELGDKPTQPVSVYTFDESGNSAKLVRVEHSQPNTPPLPAGAVGNFGTGVQVPSTAGNGNKTVKRAQIKTKLVFDKLIPYGAERGYFANDANAVYHVTAVAAKQGYNEITDANLNEVIAALDDYYKAKAAVEAQEEANHESVA